MKTTSIRRLAHNNDSYDYKSNAQAFLNAVDAIAAGGCFDRFPVSLIFQALLSVDAQKCGEDSDAIVHSVRRMLYESEYHEQEKVLAFQIYALVRYAAKKRITLSHAYNDFLQYGIFDTLQDHYFIQHTKGMHSVVSFVNKRIDGLKEIWQENDLIVSVSSYNEMLIGACDKSDADISCLHCVKNSCKRFVSEHPNFISNEIASVAIINEVFFKIPFDITMDNLDVDRIRQERTAELHFLFASFLDYVTRFGNNIKRWLARGYGLGVLFNTAQNRSEETMKHGNDVIHSFIANDKAKRTHTRVSLNQMSIITDDDEDKEPATFKTYSASTTGEPIVIQAPPFEPDAYDEDGNPIVYIN